MIRTIPHKTASRLRAAFLFATPLALAATLAACGDQGAGGQVVVPAPLPSTTGTPTPTPSATATTVAYNVDNCFSQQIQGQTGATATLHDILTPDTVHLDLARATRWPNGRHPSDPVVDLLLATLFLDMKVTGQGPNTFVNIPLDPPSNDKPFSLTFPFLAAPNGSPQVASGTGSGFNFRTDPDSAYVSVDRMGNPAIATAIIGSSMKLTFNDSTPTDDLAGTFAAEEKNELKKFFGLIGDDLVGLGLKICATTS